MLEHEDIAGDRRTIELSVDVRYSARRRYMNLRLDEGPRSAAAHRGHRRPATGAATSASSATAARGRRRGRARQRARGRDRPDRRRRAAQRVRGRRARRGVRERHAMSTSTRPSEFTETPIYDRAQLGGEPGSRAPPVIEQADTTLLVPPGASARVDGYLNIVIDVAPPGGARASRGAAGATKGSLNMDRMPPAARNRRCATTRSPSRSCATASGRSATRPVR